MLFIGPGLKNGQLPLYLQQQPSKKFTSKQKQVKYLKQNRPELKWKYASIRIYFKFINTQLKNEQLRKFHKTKFSKN